MKNFYYFSKHRLKFVEVRNFYKKFVFLILFFSLIISFVVFGSYFVIKELINPDAEVNALLKENQMLMDKLSDVLERYKEVDHKLDELSAENNVLRLRVDLPAIDSDERELGIGGRIFEEVNPSSSAEVNDIVNKLSFMMERIDAKMSFESDNYKTLKEKIISNAEFYRSVPAIKPADGPYGDRFGSRFHPILKVRRMHNGIDILVNTGTKTYATGDGKVIFSGRKGGLGIAVEIDHGFGYKSIYGHLSKTLVKKGAKVKRGDLIALSGNSGRLSTGPHLHYEVRHNGVALNPRNFIFDNVNLFEIQKAQEN